MHRTFASLALLATLLSAAPAALANERLQVLTSFSILADMVENIGGNNVEVTALVGPDSDAHVYSPRPTDARAVSQADLVVLNGMNFEGWMERLVKASDHHGLVVTATDGVEARLNQAKHDHDHAEHDHHDHAEHDHHDRAGHDHGGKDPHAWQDLALGDIYINNILAGLIAADPENEAAYRQRAEQYLAEVNATHTNIQQQLAELPDTTKIITSHRAFDHFARAYGLTFLSPAGVSSEAEPSAADLAALVEVVREQDIRALFHENMTSQALLNQLAEETGVPIAGSLYSDALTSDGDAATWLGMLRHNARVLHDALIVEHEPHPTAD
ncbi:metal ABC transporter solute-binding protein, Zn/Mn family [Halomonas halocynthiae]|uniref:metal ABC transporter solute-binding protein, Zn/Mn family n=1 Tax=Halomonas halocynthiae TaxID=176290 RepID=UPI0003FE48D2|nr:zinc ABC transporter substrate-binding protein [Halomonas halocynthiae]